MRWHKIVAQILLLIGVSLAAPVLVPEVCEACANGLDKGEDVSGVSWKRVDEEGDPLGLQPSQIGPEVDFAAGVEVAFSVSIWVVRRASAVRL
jgi:hypothetical protein